MTLVTEFSGKREPDQLSLTTKVCETCGALLLLVYSIITL